MTPTDHAANQTVHSSASSTFTRDPARTTLARMARAGSPACRACAALLCVVLAACAQAERTAPAAGATPMAERSMAEVSMADLSTGRGGQRIVASGWMLVGTHVVAVREGKSGEMRKVAVDVTGDESERRRFAYRFEWFDAAGMPAGEAGKSMTTIAIRPRETLTLTTVAPTASASQWRLILTGK